MGFLVAKVEAIAIPTLLVVSGNHSLASAASAEVVPALADHYIRLWKMQFGNFNLTGNITFEDNAANYYMFLNTAVTSFGYADYGNHPVTVTVLSSNLLLKAYNQPCSTQYSIWYDYLAG